MSKSFAKPIILLALPLLVGQLGHIAVGFADNIMVGRHGTEELAAASFVNNFFNMAILACIGFTNGLTPLIGALYSRGQSRAVGRYLRVGLHVNLAFTAIVCAVMLALYFCLGSMGQPEELLPYIRPYYLIVLAGMIPICVFNVFAQWSFGIGNTLLPTAIMITCNVINIAGNYVLIYGHYGAPELGLMGAGWSTFGARTLGALAMAAVFLYFGRAKAYRGGFRSAGEGRGVHKAVISTGFPVAMQMFFETAAFSGSAIIAGFVGTIPLAALQIIITLGMFGFCIYYSVGGAMAIEMSHAAGRSDSHAMRRCAADGYVITLVTMLAAIALFVFGGRYIIGWFTEDAEVIAAAAAVIFPLVLYQLGDATQITFASALRGTSRVTPMLYIAFFSYMLLGIPSTYLLAITAGMGLYGIVLSFSVSLFTAGILYLYFFMRSTRGKVFSTDAVDNC